MPSGLDSTAFGPVQAQFRNVDFRFAADLVLRIHRLRGELRPTRRGAPVVLDDKRTFLLTIASAETGFRADDLTRLMNGWVFAYDGAPLKDLRIDFDGDRLVQSGVMHKGVDIPFTMEAALSVTAAGMIRLHPTSMKICTIPGKRLMEALGIRLSDLLDLSGATGVRVDGNDLILDPTMILPPPAISGRLGAVAIRDGELRQRWVPAGVEARAARPLLPPDSAPNYMFFSGGTLRFGKMYMVAADMEVVDLDPSDPLDFFLDRYNVQLVAGHTDNLPDFGLLVHMADFGEVGADGEALTARR